MDEDGSSGPGLVPEVINLFIANTNRILNDIAGLLSAPKTPFFPSAFVMSSWVLISSALLSDAQDPAHGLQQGRRPGASAQGVQRQVMTMINHLFPRPIFNSRRRAIQMCLSSACSSCRFRCCIAISRRTEFSSCFV